MAAQEGRGGQGGKPSPVQVAKALGGIEFPKWKDELISYARGHDPDGDPGVLEVLKEIPDGEYGSMAEVERGVGEVV